MSQNGSAIEVKVGALVLFSLALLGGFVFVLGDISFSSGKRFHVTFENAAGLKPGADVAVAGLKVGQVESLSFMTEESSGPSEQAVSVRATLRVNSTHVSSIRKTSNFYISTRSVLGEPYIEVVTSTLDAEPLPAGATVEGVSPPRTDLLISKTSTLLDEFIHLFDEPEISVKEFFKHTGSLIKHLDLLLLENRSDITEILSSGRQAAQNAANMLAALDYAVGDGKIMRGMLGDAAATAGHAESIARRVDGDIEPITSNVAETTERVRKVAKVADELMVGNRQKVQESVDNLHASSENLREVSENANAMVARIEAGDGTVGQLMNDREVYDDLRELLRIIKRQPWKIMWKK
jgi:phospholipid/cholesterol/gamma-HCH transport system substrate-binding protein